MPERIGDSLPTVPAPPPPPPPPPTNANAAVGSWRQKAANDEKNSENERIPKALLNAFAKDKKPFTYFSGGQAPDLSGRPSPSLIRRSNYTQSIGLSIPKVLPIVSDQELQRETSNGSVISNKNLDTADDMATVTHAQYNSPMGLYSKENVQEVLNQTTGFSGNRPHSALSGQFDPHQSGAYRLLKEDGHVAPNHSARLDEEYPHYKGFVNPNIQSPSFKRLQYVTGMDSGAEDEVAQAEMHGPAQTRSDDIRSGAGSRLSGVSQEPIAMGYSGGGGQQPQQQPHQPKWSEESGPPVAEFDRSGDTDRDHPLDPNFAARIAEAERPKVPPPVVPSWTHHAERKREKWRQYGSDQSTESAHHQQQYPQSQQQYQYQPQQQSHYQQQQTQYQQQQHQQHQQQQQFRQQEREYRSPQPQSQPQPPPQSQWTSSTTTSQDKWQAHYAPIRFDSGNASVGQSYYEKPRSRSVEPSGGSRRSRWGGGKEWLKPYIAPNVLSAKFSPPAFPSYSPLSSGQRPQQHDKPMEFGQYYGPPSGGRSYSQTRAYNTDTSTNASQQYQSNRQQQEFGTSYYPYQQREHTPRKEVSVSSLVSGEAERPGPQTKSVPSWSKHAEYKRTVWESQRNSVDPDTQRRQVQEEPAPNWTQRAEQTHSVWQNEADAWRQRQSMEQELARRSASVGPPAGGRQVATGGANTPTWRQRPVPHESTTVSTYTTGGNAATPVQRWQQAPGGETKSQSSGSYLDQDGNRVSFTKEVYTSSDPGKEFSMLTEQEKKVLEEPLQPGVVSRHVTTKYYKKSTYTSSTSTSTSQTPPTTTTITRHYQPTPTPSSAYDQQRFGRGVSEF